MPLQNRAPRHEREIARALDQCVPSAGHLDRADEPSLEPLPCPHLAKRDSQLVRHPAGHAQQLAPLERAEHAAPIDRAAALLLGKAFGDQPLPPNRLRGAYLASEAGVARCDRVVCSEFAIEPGRRIGSDKPVEPSLDAATSGGDVFNGFSSPVVSPPPPSDTDAIIREAEQAAERARAQAAQAEAQARAQANRALERARQQTQQARQRARPQPAGDKPEDDGKPPEDW